MTLLAFFCGLIFGAILGGLSVLTAMIVIFYLEEKGRKADGIIKTIEKEVEKRTDPVEAKIFNTPTDVEIAQEKIIKEHADRGEDTPLEKL